jgi:alpha-tubulin suppressor-like RCC1 family protein
MRAPSLPTASLLAAALAALAAVQACGDTLIDHDGKDFIPTGGSCTATQVSCQVDGGSFCIEEDPDHCGPQCIGCAAAPQNAFRVCAAHSCEFECNPGFLRCGSACCTAADVAAGSAHTCAVTSAGGVRCWGANDQGQLGDGTTGDRTTPVDAAGITGATALAAGVAHACAVVSGAVWCWGANAYGQLGDGTTAGRPLPAAVGGLSGIVAVAAGERHTCALAGGGGVWCWGDNAFGQLGTGGTPAQSTTPVRVASLVARGTTTGTIAAGQFHACALTPAGAVMCWGRNDKGQVGKGTVSSFETSPVAAGTLTGALYVAGGSAHTCAAVGPAGSEALWGWGDDTSMQLGVSTLAVYPGPVQENNVSTRPIAMAAGRAHSCALKADVAGALKCFGANGSGQLGTPLPTDKNDVAFPGALTGPARIAAGGDHSCAVLGDGTLWCWGANARGQVGDGTLSASRADPTPVSGR